MSRSAGDETVQEEVSAFLTGVSDFGRTGSPVEVVETHISRIFMDGDRVLKMKRPVVFPYLDFSTLEKRHAACLSEIDTNRRTAPEIYRGIVPVTRSAAGDLELAGDGNVVEWLVEMKRFDQDGLLDRLVQSGQMRRHPMIDLADHIAEFHAAAAVRRDKGGVEGTGAILDNIRSCLEDRTSVLDAGMVAEWARMSAGELARVRDVLEARRESGTVRHCHGDMHLGNICMIDGKPVLFDGIEFNPDFSEIDTLYDLAFLLMDLDFRGQRRLANVVMNRYFDVTGGIVGEPGTLDVLALFLSMRAAVRAHVDAAQAADIVDSAARRDREAEARRYLDAAVAYLRSRAPRLVAVGGLSGSGKSRMARELAPDLGAGPGARVVRTDAVRKRISGVAQEDRLGPEGYTADMHAKTYDALYAEARTALAAGAAVVLDAVFPNAEQRARAEALAAEMGTAFDGLWIEAPEDVRIDRVKARQRNISDVTEEVAREQSSYVLGDIAWTRIDSSGPKDATVARGRHVLGVD